MDTHDPEQHDPEEHRASAWRTALACAIVAAALVAAGLYNVETYDASARASHKTLTYGEIVRDRGVGVDDDIPEEDVVAIHDHVRFGWLFERFDELMAQGDEADGRFAERLVEISLLNPTGPRLSDVILSIRRDSGSSFRVEAARRPSDATSRGLTHRVERVDEGWRITSSVPWSAQPR